MPPHIRALCFAAAPLVAAVDLAGAEVPFCIEVLDEATGRGVPLVELETMDNQLYVTDSAGRVAFHEPGQMSVPVWFSMRTHGYDVPVDGFGSAGKRLTPETGGKATIKLKRRNLAERLCRLTGQGIYRDTVLLGEKAPIAEPLNNGGVVGQDSIQATLYRGRIFWMWGDTSRLSYPLGNFRMSGAWSDLPGKGGLAPSRGVNYRYSVDASGFSRPMCPIPERPEGVVWLDGVATVWDDDGRERLVARYQRRRGLEALHEQGFAIFNDEKEIFEPVKTLPNDETWRHLHGPVTPVSADGADWLYCGDAGPSVRVPARLSAVLDPAQYEAWTCAGEGVPRRGEDGTLDFAWRKDGPPIESPKEAEWLKQGLIKAGECRVTPEDIATKQRVTLHAGSVRWNAFRQRWVLIAVQIGGEPSFLGEVWFAEATAPTGPWRRAVKVVTHDRYSFYNPVHHAFFDEDDGRLIYFEGTYSHTFSGNPKQTPRYDYNQILYRLDLSDPRLREAQE